MTEIATRLLQEPKNANSIRNFQELIAMIIMPQFILELLWEQRIVIILIIIIFTALKAQQLHLIVDIEIILIKIRFVKLMVLFRIHLAVVMILVHMLLAGFVNMLVRVLLLTKVVLSIVGLKAVELAQSVAKEIVLLALGNIHIVKI
jgi:hypothetical protein